jgi:hypothetical protein
MRNHTKPLLAGSALIALALVGCGTKAAVGTAATTTPKAPARTSAPATRAPAAVPVLRIGKTVTVTMPAGLDPSGSRQYTTEKWTLNSARVLDDSEGAADEVLNATVTNVGPSTLSGGNVVLGYSDWYAVNGSQVTSEANGVGYAPASDTAPQLADVNAVAPGQSTTGDFGIAKTASTYDVDQGDTATPVMIVELAATS